MAEVIGIVAGVAGLADVGARLSHRLREVVRSWMDGPSKIFALNNEVSDLTTVLRFAENICRGARHIYMSDFFTTTLEQNIRRARQFLEGMEDIVTSLSSTTETKRRRRWM